MAFFFAMGSQGIVRAWLAFKLTQSELALGTVMVAVAVGFLFQGNKPTLRGFAGLSIGDWDVN